MSSIISGFQNYSQEAIRSARYIGQGFLVTLDHMNRTPTTIQYPYEKLIPSERFRGRIHFEFDKCTIKVTIYLMKLMILFRIFRI